MNTQSIKRTSILVVLMALLGALFASGANAKDQDTDRYIVVFEDSVGNPANLAKTQTENRGADLGYVYRHAAKGYSAELTKAEVEGLRKDSRVDFVSHDHVLEFSAVPTGVERIFAAANADLDIDNEDDLRADVDVAVIDTGIDHKHPDLNVAGRTDCATEKEGAFKCVDNAGEPVGSHGTHVAGTVGALDNGSGPVGVAAGARLWSVRITFDLPIKTFESSAVAGVDWVTAHSDVIEVANMSFICHEGVEPKCPSGLPALDLAITGAVEEGVVMVAAAGNAKVDAKDSHPASHPDVIAVSALEDFDGKPGVFGGGAKDELASFSNFGSVIDLAAPGVNISSTIPGGGHGLMSGTSMAAPHVAGAAALLAAHNNPESAEDVEAIRDTLVEEGNFDWFDDSGDGITEPLLDVGNEAVFNMVPEPDVATQAATSITATTATLKGTVNPNGFATTYQLQYGKTTSYGSKVPVSPKAIGSGTTDIAVEEPITGLQANTTYHFRVTAENEEGTTAGFDRTFTTADKPQATTKLATGVTATTADLNATVNPKGAATTYQFEYGKTVSYGSKAPASPKGIGAEAKEITVKEPITGLEAKTTYHFRVVATNEAGTTYGADQQLTTPSGGTPTFTFSLAFGKSGTANGQFAAPYGVAVDPEGDVWVADAANNRVQQFNSKGEYLSKFGTTGSGDGQLKSPYGVAIDAEGDIWVADAVNHRVQQFNQSGGYLSKFGTSGTGNGQFNTPSAVAIDAQGDVWVTDAENKRVQQFKSNGEYLSKFGSLGSGNGQFSKPLGIAIDPQGDVWVTDRVANRVQQFNQSGEYMSKFGSGGTGNGQFKEPAYLAFHPSGSLLVTDVLNHRVQQFNQSGEYLNKFGTAGSGNGQFLGPVGIAIDSAGDAWVADQANTRVHKWAD